jgi:hypothetical protein
MVPVAAHSREQFAPKASAPALHCMLDVLGE